LNRGAGGNEGGTLESPWELKFHLLAANVRRIFFRGQEKDLTFFQISETLPFGSDFFSMLVDFFKIQLDIP
jgi:hypothetical protein